MVSDKRSFLLLQEGSLCQKATNVKSISFGNTHMAYIDTKGDVYMWGDVSHGEIGNEDYTSLSAPTKMIYSFC